MKIILILFLIFILLSLFIFIKNNKLEKFNNKELSSYQKMYLMR